MDLDEPVILESRNVKFKSISFNAILTNTRIHLTPGKNYVIPSQDIPLVTIRNVETGENAIRDHFLILSLMTDSGEKHQVVLTFARQAGVERKRECNEWAKKLKSLIPPPPPVIAPPEIFEVEREPLKKREIPTPSEGTATRQHPPKKKVEISRPLGTVIEKSPGAQAPEETLPLPPGSFCTRCGNRVPLKSTFCNNCGSPITKPSMLTQEPQAPVSEGKESFPFRQPQPVLPKKPKTIQPPEPQPPATRVPEPVQPPEPQPPATRVPEPVQPPEPQPPTTRVPEPVQPPAGSPEKDQGIPIAEEIRSIEPQINDSESSTRQQSEPSSIVSQAGPSPQVVWPVFSQAKSPAAPAQKAGPAGPAPPSRLIPVPEGKKPHYVTIGILIIAILPVLIGLIIVANIIIGPSEGPANTPPVTPVTTATLNQSAPQGSIPSSGVWVRVSYAGTYIGLIGTPGNQIEVNDTGDHFYPIPAGEKTIAAALQKKDSSANQIILEVYQNGVLLKRETSVAPKAIVEILFELKKV